MSSATDEILDLIPAAEPRHEMAKPKIANVAGRLGTGAGNAMFSALGMPWTRRLSKAALLLPKIREFETLFLTLNDEDMRTASTSLRGKARGGVTIDGLIPEAFGLACAAIRLAALFHTATLAVAWPKSLVSSGAR